MQNKTNPSLIESLPVEILGHIFSFLSEQEQIEIVQQLRLVSKDIKTFVSSDHFLKTCAPLLFLKNQKNMRGLIPYNVVFENQIKNWNNLKNEVMKSFDGIYENLPDVIKVKRLLGNIQRTPLPATYYFSIIRQITQPKLIRLLFAFVLMLAVAAVLYSRLELPKAETLQRRANELEEQLLAEGCVISQEHHGGFSIDDCNDTATVEELTNIMDKIFHRTVGPIIVDCLAAFFLLLSIIYVGSMCQRIRRNQPGSYEDLSIVNLRANHQENFRFIKDSFSTLYSQDYQKISDITTALKNILSEKELPLKFYSDAKINDLREEYASIITTLDAELQKLENPDNKLLFSANMANGELKTAFRGTVYSFFAKCKESAAQQIHACPNLEDVELCIDSEELDDWNEKTPFIR